MATHAAARTTAAGDAAVPQLIHDSMFETEVSTNETWDTPATPPPVAPAIDSVGAIPVPADQQTTRREGLGRVPRLSPPSRPSAPGLPGLSTRGADPVEPMRVESPPSGAARAPLPGFSAPSGALRAPAARPAPPASPGPATTTGEAAAPSARLGKSSAPMAVPAVPSATGVDDDLQTELTPSLEDSIDTAAPRRMPTPPSLPTVPIRPPAAVAAIAAARAPHGAAESAGPGRRDSSLAIGSPVPVSAAELASVAAPTALEDATFATVPTPVPSSNGAAREAAAHAALQSLEFDDSELVADSDPMTPVVPATAPSSSVAAPLPMGPADLGALAVAPAHLQGSPFSDPGSVSAPLPAVAPVVPLEAPPPVQAAAPMTEEQARHARARQIELGAALDAKIEIDPALYAESAIARSFENNFVLPGEEPRPWQEVPTPWSGQPSGPAPMPPAPAPPQPYGGYQPYPGYDPSFPVAVSSGDETALVTAPAARRGRTWVIVGSAILVLLAGLAIYLYLDHTGKRGTTPAPTPTATPATTAPGATPASAAPAPAPGSDQPAAVADDAGASPTASAGLDANDRATPDDEAAKPAVKADGCKVKVGSQPSGATVVLDGKELGATPLETELPCAGATVTFRKSGRAELVRELGPLTAGKAIMVTLEVEQIEIEVITAPFAARIRVNNKEVGRSPVKLKVPAGVPVLLSSAKDGRAASVKVTPSAQNRSFTLDLKRSARAPKKTGGGGSDLPDL